MLENVRRRVKCVLLWAPLVVLTRPQAVFAVRGVARAESVHAWWASLPISFFFCFVFGVLFVPLVRGFFANHIDFVPDAGLMVVQAGPPAAGAALPHRNLASLRLLNAGDHLNYIELAILALTTILCYLVFLTGYIRRNDRIYRLICVLEVPVLGLAAPGVLGASGS